MHGAYKMGTIQMCKHGNAEGWDSSYGERMHQHFFTRLGHNTQRRHALFAQQIATRRYEFFTVDTAINHSNYLLMDNQKDCHAEHDDDEDENDHLNQEIQWNYHDDNIPRNDQFTGTGKYEVIKSLDEEDDSIMFDLRWKDRDAHDSKKKISDKILLGTSLYASTNNWDNDFSFTGYTSIKKMDATTNKDVTYRSDINYKGKPWQDWVFFYFNDHRKPADTVSVGLILGFIQFNSPGFPSPNHVTQYGSDIPSYAIDKTGYVVARCSNKYQNYDTKFCTQVTLERGKDSIYFIPMKDLIGPIAIVPNIYTQF